MKSSFEKRVFKGIIHALWAHQKEAKKLGITTHNEISV